MSTEVEQFRVFIVQPTLHYLGNHSPAAEELLMGTVAQESHFKFLDQLDRDGEMFLGPAIGFYQMEQLTHDDIWENFLKYHQDLAAKILRLKGDLPAELHPLLGNLYYATAMARVLYYRQKEELPAATDLQGLAHYWKRYYNTTSGAGTVDQFVKNYKQHVNGIAH